MLPHVVTHYSQMSIWGVFNARVNYVTSFCNEILKGTLNASVSESHRVETKDAFRQLMQKMTSRFGGCPHPLHPVQHQHTRQRNISEVCFKENICH